MKRFHHNIKNGKRPALVFFLVALAGLITAAFLFGGFPPPALLKPAFFILKPFIYVKNAVSGGIMSFVSGFYGKQSLYQENKILREKTEELESRIFSFDSVMKENEEYKSVLGRSQGAGFLLANVISRHGVGDYEGFLLDAGYDNGVKDGMPVTAYGEVLLGYTEGTTADSTKVRFISSPGTETNVYIGGAVSAVAKGTGAGNMEIYLPHGIEIKEKDVISSFESKMLVLGFAEKIEKETANPFQKILSRIPLNTANISRVYIIGD
jgi:cell shape-determining protein MreC